jgi:N4-gp56 family major capsid protein
MQGYASLSDLDRAKYNAKVRVAAANIVIYPQFFDQEDIMPKTHAAVFTVFAKLSAAVADTDLTTSYAITEKAATDISESQVTITAGEMGNTVATTQAIDYTSIVDLAEAKNLIVSINMAEGLDNKAAYMVYAALTSNDSLEGPLTGTQVFKTARDFYDGSVPVRGDGLYGAICSAMTQYDLFSDPTLKGFVPLKLYTHPELAYNMEIGAYGGFRWVVGPSAYHATVSNARHDYPLFFGAGAFGQANGYDPEMVIENSLDRMHRFHYVSWKAQRGYGVINSSYVRQYDVIPTA